MWKDTRETRLKRYQNCLKKYPQFYKAALSAGKAARPGNSESTEMNVCDYVLSPALNGFVLWVLRKALADKKQRLYFMARDGYMMYRAAQIFCERYHLPVDCRYLSCSRYSLRIPMYQLDLEEAFSYICRGGIDVTVEKILRRAGLTIEEQSRVLEKTGLSAEQWIPYAQLPEIRKVLEKCGLFRQYLYIHSKRAFPALEGYLKQEGLFEDVPSAIVDSGWVGSMQKVLNRLLAEIQRQHPELPERELQGYYWGLYELPEQVDPSDYQCYYFTPGENLKEKIYFSNCLFEGIFSAPHGMTLEYGENETGFYPVYAEASEEHRCFMERLEERLTGYTQTLVETAGDITDLYPEGNCDREVVRGLFSLFMGEPTMQEVRVYGTLTFSDDVLEEGGQQIAAPLSRQQLKENGIFYKLLLLFGLRKAAIHESAWFEGSVVREGYQVKRYLRRYAGYKRLLYLRKRWIWRKMYG